MKKAFTKKKQKIRDKNPDLLLCQKIKCTISTCLLLVIEQQSPTLFQGKIKDISRTTNNHIIPWNKRIDADAIFRLPRFCFQHDLLWILKLQKQCFYYLL